MSADLQQARALNATDKNLSEGGKTALNLQKMACQQCISSYVAECEKLVADKATIHATFWYCRTDMDTMLGELQDALDYEMIRVDED